MTRPEKQPPGKPEPKEHPPTLGELLRDCTALAPDFKLSVEMHEDPRYTNPPRKVVARFTYGRPFELALIVDAALGVASMTNAKHDVLAGSLATLRRLRGES